jgi:glycosyltransferase involved in cell wall biosynthesis
MSTEPSILYISYDGMTDPLGRSQVLPYLAGLSALGYRITMLSCEKPGPFASLKEEIEAITSAAGITWVPLPYTRHPPVLSTVRDVWRLRRAAAALHLASPFTAVHCRSYVAALVGLKMKERFGCRFIFDMRGFWADERVDGNLWRLSNPLYRAIYRYFKRMEKRFLENADSVITLTEAARREIHDWPLRNNPVPIEVIPCCVDTALFSPGANPRDGRDGLRSGLGIGANDLVLSYLGSLGTWYMLGEMLDFFSRLLLRHPSARFLFVTIDDPAVILREAAERGIDPGRIVVRSAERAEVPMYIAASDLSIFFIRPTYSKKASSPTKQGELMSMGTPVICNAGVGDTDEVVRRYRSGVLVPRFGTAEYDAAVDRVGWLTSLDPAAIRRGALEFYSLEEGIRRYSGVYARVHGREP